MPSAQYSLSHTTANKYEQNENYADNLKIQNIYKWHKTYTTHDMSSKDDNDDDRT